MDKSIIPECFADTLLIEMLVPTKNGYNHQHNCYKVEATMKGLDGFALGIIDNDKKQIKYLDHFKPIDQIEGELLLWRHENMIIHHWIIQICPALEKWILNICEKEAIDLSGFGENALDGIKRHTKSVEKLDDPKLKALFSQISKKDDNKSVKKLRNWVSVLKEKNYQVDINELKNV